MTYRRLLALPFLVAIISTAAEVRLTPGDDVRSIVESSPVRTTFVFGAGLYRNQWIIPKDGNTFLADGTVVLSGARLLNQFQREGQLWVADGITAEGQQHGECRSSHPACHLSEDLFIDDQPLVRVLSRSQVRPGRWYFDYVLDRIYVADDPVGHRVEISVTKHAFEGAARDVTIRGLQIEKYASPAQFGAINAQSGNIGPMSNGWLVDSCVLRWNHGAGIRVGHGMSIYNSTIHHNGQLGIVGAARDVEIAFNTISFNNYNGFDNFWEAGGVKLVRSENSVIRQNYVHNNDGPGLWTDIDCRFTLYDGNTVVDNRYMGISHEISYDAVIRRNTVERNGAAFDVWLWGSQILVQNSQNVVVYENDVTVSPFGGDGIGLIHQERGAGAYGPYETRNNLVFDNSITYLGREGESGAVSDTTPTRVFDANNRFNRNRHIVAVPGVERWRWRGDRGWSGFRTQGQEPTGELLVAEPLVLSGRQRPVAARLAR